VNALHYSTKTDFGHPHAQLFSAFEKRSVFTFVGLETKISIAEAAAPEQNVCFHCGEDCVTEDISEGEKHFCCHGCKTVYEILNENNLCSYYSISRFPGQTKKNPTYKNKFGFLLDKETAEKLLLFNSPTLAIVTFSLPQIHCSSCLWLLEHSYKLNPGIIKSEINFLEKEARISFDPKKTDLKSIAETLSSVGYEPHIHLDSARDKKQISYSKTRIFKIGIAGFCFGNIMMLSLPEYFSGGLIEDKDLKQLFPFLNLILAMPVFFYCASGFFTSAWQSLKQKSLNIDAPIAVAILITFTRSFYEILSGTGAGYLDSMSGIVFFMLLGRFFQERTYERISFERDYKSYFPLGITRVKEDTEEQIPVSKLKAGDRIRIRSEEIIPADSILFSGCAKIDYSFVTGESKNLEVGIGQIIYAGGKQAGGILEMEVIKEVSQSYLTGLWNNPVFSGFKEAKQKSFVHKLSALFSLTLFLIALAAGIYWQLTDPAKLWTAVSSVLIVACPCSLLLSATFTNGSILTFLRKKDIYLKNAGVIEQIAETDAITFDKTGTITHRDKQEVSWEGIILSSRQQQLISSLAAQSFHPTSKAINSFFKKAAISRVKNFREVKGYGTEGNVEGEKMKLGSAKWVGADNDIDEMASAVYVSLNDSIIGKFKIQTAYRKNLANLISDLSHYKISLLSGDNNRSEKNLRDYFGRRAIFHFNCSPQQKLDYIKQMQQEGKKVMMIGDGLNDAGALKQADCGIVVTDDINNFMPASDVILHGKNFQLLPALIDYCKTGRKIIYAGFIVSILYNLVGLYFATRAELQPVIAAILMPLSSVSIVLIATLASSIAGRRIFRAGENAKIPNPDEHQL
jgi:P-type Cu+ transporter